MWLSGSTDAYESWLRDIRHLSENTIENYVSTARLLIRWWDTRGGQPSLGDLEDFVSRKRRGGKIGSASTQANDVHALQSLYGWGIREGLVEKNAAAELIAPNPHNLNPRAIDDAVWRKLWQTPLLTDRERAWLGLGFFCGLRCSELLTIEPSHVAIGQRKLVNFKRKGGGDHTLPVGTILNVFGERLPELGSDRLWPALERLQGHVGASERICGYKNRGSLNQSLARYRARHDLPYFSVHALRHSFVTNLLRAGVPLHLVSRLANHTNVTTTMRYVRAGGDELQEWLNGS